MDFVSRFLPGRAYRRHVFRALLFSFLGTSSALGQLVDDISPDRLNGVVQGRPSTAGLVSVLAGTEDDLYALTPHAGIWRATRDGRWHQLLDSPARATSIAIRRINAQNVNVVVGERDGEAVPIPLNDAGLWEHFTGNGDWVRILDPLTLGCSSQAIPAVVFAGSANAPRLFAATSCGVASRAPNGRFGLVSGTTTYGGITALATSTLPSGGSILWARSRDFLLYSSNLGLSWTQVPFPGPGLSMNSRGDPQSMAAYGSTVFFMFTPTPGSCPDPSQPASSGVLFYNRLTRAWTEQPICPSGNGTGLGGRRFVKAFPTSDGPPRLFAGIGQEVLIGADWDSAAGRPRRWDIYARSTGSEPPGDEVHADLWDLHLSSSLSDPANPVTWVASDGGVYRKTLQASQWANQNEGLHTHHIHVLTVLPKDIDNHARLAYATADNDAWYRRDYPVNGPVADWQSKNFLGDANWTAGDAGSPSLALLARQNFNPNNLNAGTATLTGFGDVPPLTPSVERGLVLNFDETFSGPQYLRFIQTPESAPSNPYLDAVFVVRPPLLTRSASGTQRVPVQGGAGLGGPNPNPSGGPILIRSREFAKSPDAAQSQFAPPSWTVEATDLPAGARSVWIANGHVAPVYYVYDMTSGGRLLKRGAPGSGIGGTSWSVLLLPRLRPAPRFGPLLPHLGPAFVNPYDAGEILVLTEDGVMVSADGGASPFQPDHLLTSAVTNAGLYDLDTLTFGGNEHGGVVWGIATRWAGFGVLSEIAFSHDDPREIVAASPFGGVFFRGTDGSWRDLTGFLPKPLAPSSVGIDQHAIYVATEGRGILRVRDFRNAPRAMPLPIRVKVNPGAPSCGNLIAHYTPLSIAAFGGLGGIQSISYQIVPATGAPGPSTQVPGDVTTISVGAAARGVDVVVQAMDGLGNSSEPQHFSFYVAPDGTSVTEFCTREIRLPRIAAEILRIPLPPERDVGPILGLLSFLDHTSRYMLAANSITPTGIDFQNSTQNLERAAQAMQIFVTRVGALGRSSLIPGDVVGRILQQAVPVKLALDTLLTGATSPPPPPDPEPPTVSEPSCGETSAPNCDGACPSGFMCAARDEECGCRPAPGTCGLQGAPECWGECPTDSPFCVDAAAGCICTSEPPGCDDSEAPSCNGRCPPGEICAVFGELCSCQPLIPDCGDAQAPECAGACPAGQQCEVSLELFCACR